MEEKKKLAQPKAQKSKLEIWEQLGIPCHYVRFHQPIPRFENDEPVSEFRIKVLEGGKKYGVQAITYTEHGIIWRAKGEINLCALANVMYARAINS